MSVYVDDMYAPFGNMLMCHMVADTHDELIAMAQKIGVQLKWIQHAGRVGEHFDIAKTKRALAIKAGAIEITWTECGRREYENRHNLEEWKLKYFNREVMNMATETKKPETHSNVYKGKHKHQEVAEFVTVALAVWDRQHGMISNSWEALNTTEKAAAVQRVKDYEDGKVGNAAKDDRETLEFFLYDALLGKKGKKEKEPEDKDLKALIKEAKAPLPDRGKVEIHGTETGRISSDPNDKPPTPPSTVSPTSTEPPKPTIVK